MTLPKKPGVSKAKKKKPATARKSIPQARKESKKARLAKKVTATKRLETKKRARIGKDKGKMGAPSKKTPEILRAICVGISVGKSARAMAKEVGIDQSTIWDWLAADEDFSKQYARAKEDCADYLAGEILEIADTPVRGLKTTTKANGEVETVEGDMIEHRRLQVDARKWYASKLAPKKYGDRTVLAGDPTAPQRHEHTVTALEALVFEKVRARRAVVEKQT